MTKQQALSNKSAARKAARKAAARKAHSRPTAPKQFPTSHHASCSNEHISVSRNEENYSLAALAALFITTQEGTDFMKEPAPYVFGGENDDEVVMLFKNLKLENRLLVSGFEAENKNYVVGYKQTPQGVLCVIRRNVGDFSEMLLAASQVQEKLLEIKVEHRTI